MAKGMYLGIDNIAHKVKKMYVGINDVAHKVKKIFVGIGGIAKLVWTSAPSIEKEDTGVSLSYYYLTKAYNSYYALLLNYNRSETSPSTSGIAINDNNCTTSNIYTKFNASLYGVTSNDNYGIVVGGKYNYAVYSYANLYDTSLVNTEESSIQFSGTGASSRVGDYALLAQGGYYGGSSTDQYNFSNRVIGFDKNGTQKSTYLSQTKDYMLGAFNANYAIFAGGRRSTTSVDYVNTVDAFNSSLTKTVASPLTNNTYFNRVYGDCTSYNVGEYAIIYGGDTESSSIPRITDVYTNSLVKLTPWTTSIVYRVSSTASRQGVFVAYGYDSSYNYFTRIFNNNLTYTDTSEKLNYLVAGGNNIYRINQSNNVSRYKIS